MGLAVDVLLPVGLLLLGLAAGALLAIFGRRWLAKLRGSELDCVPAAAPHAVPLPVADEAGTGIKASLKATDGQLHSIHVVASAPSIFGSQWDPASLQTSFMLPSGMATPMRAALVSPSLATLAGDSPRAGVRRSPFLQAAALGHRRSPSRDAQEHFMRMAPSALSQVMDEWETRNVLHRLVSDNFNLPSPQQPSGLFSPASSTLFSAAPSIAPPPSGEVHMDEIDLIDCIGKGGFGSVYKASWRTAPVAVKYIICRTDDSDSLGRAIREVVLSKKMSHPNVVQCYSWTVLTEPEESGSDEDALVGGMGAGNHHVASDTPTSASAAATARSSFQGSFTRRSGVKRSLADRFLVQEGIGGGASGSRRQSYSSLRRIAEAASLEHASGADAATSPPQVADPSPIMGVVAAGAKQLLPAAVDCAGGTCSGKLAAQGSCSPSGSPVIHALHADAVAVTAARGSFSDEEAGSQGAALHTSGSRGGSDGSEGALCSFDQMIAHFRQVAEELADAEVAKVEGEHAHEAQAQGEQDLPRMGSLRIKLSGTTSSFSDVADASSGFLINDSSVAEPPTLPDGGFSVFQGEGQADGLIAERYGSELASVRQLPPLPMSRLSRGSTQELSDPLSSTTVQSQEQQLGPGAERQQQQQQVHNKHESSTETVPGEATFVWSAKGQVSDVSAAASSIKLATTQDTQVQAALSESCSAAATAHRRSSTGLQCSSLASLAAWGPGAPPSRSGSRNASQASVLPGGEPSVAQRHSSVLLQPVPPLDLPNLDSPRFGGLLRAVPEGPSSSRPDSHRGGASRITSAPMQPQPSQPGTARDKARRSMHARDVGEACEVHSICSSRLDSFNSEEGFGSPVKHKCGGVKSVFELEALTLEGNEALMVVVMEYCDLGSLRKALKRRCFVPSAKWTLQTTYRALLRTAQEIAKGMEYIHEYNIVHGDLKPGNVLLKTHKVDRRGYIAKVSDFGLSRPLDSGQTHASMGSAMGTIAYTAPETFTTNCVKKPSDVYAFGIMMWEMFYCRDVYTDLFDGQICCGVADGSLRPEWEAEAPPAYRRLAEKCWHQEPDARPTFKEVVSELVQIEVDFRNQCHRAERRRTGNGSAPSSRPGSPSKRSQPLLMFAA